jgi:hypothetical protein
LRGLMGARAAAGGAAPPAGGGGRPGGPPALRSSSIAFLFCGGASSTLFAARNPRILNADSESELFFFFPFLQFSLQKERMRPTILLFALCAQAQTQKFTLTTLKDSHPSAQCSDGSPVGYYFSPSAQNSSTWIIFLEGGGCASFAPFPSGSVVFRGPSLTPLPPPLPSLHTSNQGATTLPAARPALRT